MNSVHDRDDVVLAFVFLQFFVLGKMRFLGLGISLAGDQLGFLVDKIETVQVRGHAAGGVEDVELGLHPRSHILRPQVQFGLYMRIKGVQPGLAQFTGAAAVGQMHQTRQPSCPISLKMVTHCIDVDQQGIGNIVYPSVACPQHHRLDAVSLALVASAAVRRTQLGKFSGWQVVVHHWHNDRTFLARYARLLREKSDEISIGGISVGWSKSVQPAYPVSSGPHY